ncbi:MFS transporter [Tessaracoccus antarcticus]|uniref:MFS transporter n=1 Tax=Tessaracoccus antarcticus TaxID=2479848 RepID=A0A3M0G7Q0_9ACTN|nr:MFS transporter [Tessaracoccus antarcticus]
MKNRLNASGLPRTTWVLSVTALLVAVGFGVVIPVLTPFAKTFEATNFQLGLVVSLFAAARLVTSPFAPAIGRRLGERNAITVGVLIVAVSTVATALAPTLQIMLIARGLGGIGSATFTISAINLLLATAPEHLRGRASGLYQGGFLLGNMTGPALGGLLSGISLQAPFYFYAVMLVVCAGFTVTMLPARATLPPAAHKRTPRRFREVIRDIRYQAACMVALGQGWQSLGVRNAFIPLFVTEALLLETYWTGIAFAIAAVAQTAMLLPAGNATDRIGRRPVMIVSGIVCGVAAIAMPFSSNIWVLVLVLCVYGVGAAMQGTAPTAAVGDATQGRGGPPVAAFSMVTDLGSIFGPLVAGVVLDVWSFQVAFAIGGVILFAGAVYAAFIPRALDREFLAISRS